MLHSLGCYDSYSDLPCQNDIDIYSWWPLRHYCKFSSFQMCIWKKKYILTPQTFRTMLESLFKCNCLLQFDLWIQGPSFPRNPEAVCGRGVDLGVLVIGGSSGGTSLAVQWLGLRTPNAWGSGLIPGWRTRSCMPQLKILPTTTETQHSQIKFLKKQKQWCVKKVKCGVPSPGRGALFSFLPEIKLFPRAVSSQPSSLAQC